MKEFTFLILLSSLILAAICAPNMHSHIFAYARQDADKMQSTESKSDFHLLHYLNTRELSDCKTSGLTSDTCLIDADCLGTRKCALNGIYGSPCVDVGPFESCSCQPRRDTRCCWDGNCDRGEICALGRMSGEKNCRSKMSVECYDALGYGVIETFGSRRGCRTPSSRMRKLGANSANMKR